VTPVLELTNVTKDYRGLRPLRVRQLVVTADESVAILGLDRAAAEVLANLITGAMLPDTGDVRVFGRATSSIADSAEWLALVDRFGLVTERAVLLDHLTVVQNLALPFTIEIEPPPDTIRQRAEALATEVGLPIAAWAASVAELDATAAARVRLGRALAHDPRLLLLEHVTASLPTSDVAAMGSAIRDIGVRRRAAILAVTADDTFARAVAGRVLRLDPATGRLVDRSRRGWFPPSRLR
jgi:polar amino acid transport system ATP-binding protein